MFEKEAEDYSIDTYESCLYDNFSYINDSRAREESFRDGATFGYNKANEWHYVKDGIMPEENQWVLVYDGSYTVCNYHSNTPIKWLDNYENEVYEGSIIAWKEIVTPKESV